MSEQQPEGGVQPQSSQPPQRALPGIGEGLKAGIGILTAFKQAIEETIQEASDRGDLKPERAKEALTGALTRAQGAFDDVRERLDVVPRRDFDALKAEVAELRRRLDALDGGGRATLIIPAGSADAALEDGGDGSGA
jgi:polyhydroxyalkanoate synthesis regulator phasin